MFCRNAATRAVSRGSGVAVFHEPQSSVVSKSSTTGFPGAATKAPRP
jgi:hypothetical protein